MITIAIAAVTAGGKTTTVNELKRILPNAQSMHFDDYTFEGEVENFHQWVLDGADYHVWNLKPLEDDIIKIQASGECEYLILDYPFAYCHDTIKPYIDVAIFIDTPLDVALARRILRDMQDATADEIRNDLEMYLKYARIAFVQMHKDILPSSDYVIDGAMQKEEIVEAIQKIINDTKSSTVNCLPESIQKLISGQKYVLDDVGMSDSQVLILDDMVLKIQPANEEAENEYQMMRWSAVRTRVPKVIAYEVCNGISYLLMSKMSGKMACDEEYMKNPAFLTKVLADGLKYLWSIDITDCPCDISLEKKLQMAKYIVENNLVDMDNCQPDTYGEDGFKDAKDLLNWLYQNQPEEELVLSHGDYCLPNVFGTGSELSGFIDLGKMGKADKWQDIALCYRSLKHNYEGKYGSGTYGDFDANQLFEELGIEPDWEKIRYYILMDELF